MLGRGSGVREWGLGPGAAHVLIQDLSAVLDLERRLPGAVCFAGFGATRRYQMLESCL